METNMNYITKEIKVGVNKNQPRIWLEGKYITLQPATRFSIEKTDNRLSLIADPSGLYSVSSKSKASADLFSTGAEIKVTPVIDLNSSKLLDIFEGIKVVRVILQKNRIDILPTATATREKERHERLNDKLKNNKALDIGSISFGGGILSHAMHSGLNDVGFKSKLTFANDIREDLLTHASEHNDTWHPDTMMLAAPLQEIAFDEWFTKHLPKVDILEMGLPCSGASIAGRSKNKLSMPEAHEQVGHLIAAAISIITKVNPSVIILENVVQYCDSASAYILRNYLKEFGYNIHEEVFEGADFNALENRKRWVLLAVSSGIEYDFSMITKPTKKTLKLADVLDNLALDDSRWSKMQGLKDKEVRDKEAGKGFAMQLFDGSEDHILTLTKGLAKNRSTDPKIRHPENPELLRIPTVAEHSRCKGIPEHLTKGLSMTQAHELLGQSIIYPVFVAIAQSIGKALRMFTETANNQFKTTYQHTLAKVG